MWRLSQDNALMCNKIKTKGTDINLAVPFFMPENYICKYVNNKQMVILVYEYM